MIMEHGQRDRLKGGGAGGGDVVRESSILWNLFFKPSIIKIS